MDYLIQLFRSMLVEPGQAEAAFAVLVGAGAMLVALSVGLIITAATDPMRKRLQLVGAPQGGAASGRKEGGASAALAGLAQKLHLRGSAQELSQLQTRLMHAGYESRTAPMVYNAVRFLLLIGLPLVVLVVAGLVPRLSVQVVVYLAAMVGGIGLMLPRLVLASQARRRQRQLMNAFPDALDLLVACTEAGMGLNAAIQRVADQLVYSHPELAQELSLVNYEIRGGVDRVTALRHLADRTGLESIRGLVGILAQTLRYGTSVAETLRVYAEDMRDSRMQAAEEQAAKIGTKMIFPLTFCLFPAFFLIAIGPAIIGVLRALGQ